MRMGIDNRGHRNRIMQLIESLPPEDIEEEVPVGHYYSVFLSSVPKSVSTPQIV